MDAFVDELRKAPEIESVDAQLFEPGKDWSYLSDRELFLLGAADAADGAGAFSAARLDRELAHARELLSTPSADQSARPARSARTADAAAGSLAREKGFVSFDPTQEGYVSKDGRSRLVIVKPTGRPFDTDFCKSLFRRLAAVESTAAPAAAGRSE